MANHSICHIEWQSTDLARSQAFFEALFGWTFRSFGDEMVVFANGEEHLGGLMKVTEVKPGSSPSVWIQVENVEKACANAVSLGGAVKAEKGSVPGVGFSAIITDLDGSEVGLVEFVSED